MRCSDDFRRVTRRGVRAGRPTVVVHAARSGNVEGSAVIRDASSVRVSRVGFVVGRHVGNAVTRNRVKRRLRHLVAARLAQSAGNGDLLADDSGESDPGGLDLVIRALPPASGAGEELAADFEYAWSRVQLRLGSAAVRSARQPGSRQPAGVGR